MSQTQRINVATPRLETDKISIIWNHLTDSDGWGWYSTKTNLLPTEHNCVLRIGWVESVENDVFGYIVEMYEITDERTSLLAKEAIPANNIPRSVAEVKAKAIARGLMLETDSLIESWKPSTEEQ